MVSKNRRQKKTKIAPEPEPEESRSERPLPAVLDHSCEWQRRRAARAQELLRRPAPEQPAELGCGGGRDLELLGAQEPSLLTASGPASTADARRAHLALFCRSHLLWRTLTSVVTPSYRDCLLSRPVLAVHAVRQWLEGLGPGGPGLPAHRAAASLPQRQDSRQEDTRIGASSSDDGALPNMFLGSANEDADERPMHPATADSFFLGDSLSESIAACPPDLASQTPGSLWPFQPKSGEHSPQRQPAEPFNRSALLSADHGQGTVGAARRAPDGNMRQRTLADVLRSLPHESSPQNLGALIYGHPVGEINSTRDTRLSLAAAVAVSSVPPSSVPSAEGASAECGGTSQLWQLSPTMNAPQLSDSDSL